MHKIILGSIEAIHELVQFIQQLSDAQYQQSAEPFSEHSMGMQLGHVLDRYQALMRSEHNQIDYTFTRINTLVEHKRFEALKELVEVENWLMALDENEFQTVKVVNSRVCLSTPHNEKLTSTLARELHDAASHVTHHLTLMRVIKSLNGNSPSISSASTHF